jgi:outer membrane receptor protein involved in Fe transport
MNVKNGKVLRLTPLAIAFAAAGFSLPQLSLAQTEEDAATAGEDLLEEVIVTGSRIRRADNLSSPTPMVSLGEDQIEFTGSVNVYDILNELPQAGEGLTRGNTNFTVGASGIQSINLRGLGSSRTLTLVNGRRWVGGVPGTNVVDLNSIPSDMIQRVEVITGGASSVYGSDAVAGVVNMILKDDYQGIDVEGMYGAYGEGDGETYSLSLGMGGNFADGRGNAMFYARVDSQGKMMARDRAPYTGSDVFYYGYYYGAAYGAPYDSYILDPAYSSYPPQGRFFISGSTSNSQGMLTFDCSQRDEDSVLPSDTVVAWSAAGGTAQCGFNRTYHRALEVPLDRYSVFGKTTYNFNDDHQAFMEISYTSVESVSEFEPVPFNSEDVFGGLGNYGYHYTNPFVPEEIAAAAVAYNANNPDWNGHIPFIRRLQEFGNRGSTNVRDTFRVAFGMQGSFGDIDYDWYYQYGESNRVQTSGAYNALNFRSALDAEYDALGNIVCASEIDRAAGCVPINVFGIGSITPEAVRWVGYESMRISNNTQTVVEANLTSDFQLFDRSISWAAGVQYREESSDDNPDDLQQLGLNGSNVVPRTQGEYDVLGGYAELLIPLISDVPIIQDLTLELAYRLDDYSTAGKVNASKIGLNWTLNDDFRFRGVYATSVRAPDINDLFAGQAQTFVPIADPCGGLGTEVEDTMDPVVVANCYSIPEIAFAAENGSFNPDLGMVVPGFVYSQPDIQTISGFVGGNPNLSEETAKTKTLGVVWTPSFAPTGSVSVDYYNIDIEDVISTVSASNLINECYETPGLTSDACVGHERFPGTGKLRYWYSFGVNQSSLKSEGIDVSAVYRFDSLGPIPGSLNLSMLWTHRLDHTFQRTPESTPEEFLGEVGYNKDKVKLTGVWQSDKWLLSVDTTYHGKALDDASQEPDDYSLNRVDPIIYVDTQLRFFPSDDWQLYVGVDNLFNQNPSYCPTCKNEPSPGSHYTGGQYRPWKSRFFYGGVKWSFGKE